MKVLLINGSPHEEGCTYTALHEVESQLQKHGIETEILHVGRQSLQPCIDCKMCWSRERCVFDDIVNPSIEKIIAADGIVIGSPVYFGGITGGLKTFLDRAFYGTKRLYSGKPAAAVVSCRRGGASTAFDHINPHFLISSIPDISSQ